MAFGNLSRLFPVVDEASSLTIAFDTNGVRTRIGQRTTPNDFLTPWILGMASGYQNRRRSVSQQIRVPQRSRIFAIRGTFVPFTAASIPRMIIKLIDRLSDTSVSDLESSMLLPHDMRQTACSILPTNFGFCPDVHKQTN